MSTIRKSALTAAVAGILMAGFAIAEADAAGKVKVETKSLTATRGQVAQACQANNGAEYGTEASSGHYGCVTEGGGYIDCDESAQCEGGRPTRPQTGQAGTAGPVTGLGVLSRN